MKKKKKSFFKKKHLIGILTLILAAVITALYACTSGIDPSPAAIAGSFASIAALVVISYILKVRDDLFFCGLLFVYFASPVGSVLDFYRSVGPYDKIVHFFSGILLASLGAMIISSILKAGVNIIKATKAYLFVEAAFAFFFSSAFAGIWEIFEFTADKLAGGEMQRGMVDTVTDIIAGNAGALIYFLIFAVLIAAGKARADATSNESQRRSTRRRPV